MKLSIVIPVYNEIDSLEVLVSRVIAVDVGLERAAVSSAICASLTNQYSRQSQEFDFDYPLNCENSNSLDK